MAAPTRSTFSQRETARLPSQAIFWVTGNEVNPLIRALRAADIEVTAIHSHMLDEQPRMFFIHFWADDDAVKLAHGVRAALDKTAVAQH